MNLQEYLDKAFLIARQINTKQEHLRELNELKNSVPISKYKEKQDITSFLNSNVENILVNIESIEQNLVKEIEVLLIHKVNIIKIIGMLEEEHLHLVFEERFLCYKKWEIIADELFYSLRHVFRLYKQGLQKLNAKDEVIEILNKL